MLRDMLNMRRHRQLAVAVFATGLVVAASAIAGALTWRDSPWGVLGRAAGGPSSGPQVHNLLRTWGSLDDLMDGSTLVVRGTLISEREEHLEIPTPGEPSMLSKRTDVVREFRVDEIISGSYDSGSIEVREAVYLWAPPPAEGFPAEEINHDVAPIEPGKSYVLFLTTARDYNGAMVLNPEAAPSVAIIEGKHVEFVVGDDYVTTATDAGLVEKGRRVPSEFTSVLLSEIRESARGKDTRVAAKEAYDAAHPGPGLIINERGTALEQLGQELPNLHSADAVITHINALGLDAKTLDDPSFCSKVQAIAHDGTGFDIDLHCGDVPTASVPTPE